MNIAHYLLQVNLYLFAFYLLYALLLSRETYFILNRVYLVSAGVLSLLIPFIRLDYFAKQEVHQQFYLSVDQMLSQAVVITEVEKHINWGLLFVGIYVFGVIFFTVKLIFKLIQVKWLFKTIRDGYAFSFLNKKIVSEDLAEQATINKHENIHIQQLHTLDVLFFELLTIINWFNPLCYFYKIAVKNIHEYLADEEASRLQRDKEAYALLLLSHAFKVSPNTLTNSFFNKTMLKQRIYMLHKQRSKRVAILKYGLFVPLFGLALILSSSSISKNKEILGVSNQIPLRDFADVKSALTAPIVAIQSINKPQNTEPNNQKSMKNKLKVAVLALATLTAQQGVAQKVDSLKIGLMNIKAVENGDTSTLNKLYVRGKGAINPLYIIDGVEAGKDGLGKIATSDIASIEVLKDQSAIALYGDKGKDGVILITIKKSGTDVTKKEFGKELQQGNLAITAKDLSAGVNPLILLDGKSISKTEMDRLKTNSILKVDVLKGSAATTAYGDKAKDGVILITTHPKNVAYKTVISGKDVKGLAGNELTNFLQGKDKSVYDFVSIEKQPEFPGGIKEFYKYVAANLKYPKDAVTNRIEGKVFLTFIIEKDGSLSDIGIMRGLTHDCDKEAIRLLSNSPKWTPGIQNGKPVRVKYNINVNFNLDK